MAKTFTAADVTDQTGKTFFVTGANTGLGFDAGKVLAGKGGRVLLGCRNPEKAEAARQRILEEHGGADVVVISLDLGDLNSVRAAAEEVAKEDHLDVLINNAGIMMPPKQFTKKGFESQFGVNHLGPFALTALLLPKLEQTTGSRIVNTSSNAHKGSDIDFDDLGAEKSYSSLGRYSQSKLANLLHTYELDRRLRAKGSKTLSVAVHPGGATTNLFRQMPTLQAVLKPFLSIVINTAAQGAWPTLLGATGAEVESGQYFGPKGVGEIAGPAKLVTSTKRSRGAALAKRLWDVSVEMTGIDPAI